MKRKALMVGLCICLMLAATGCKSRVHSLKLADIKDETVLLRSDGSVQSGAYEAFDEPYYDEDDLKAFMESAINTFNEEQGEECVKLNKLKIEENGTKHIAKAIVTYDNMKLYSAMNNIEAASYSMEEAKEAGVLPEIMTVAADGSRVSQKEVTDNTEYKVLVIQIKGDIMFPDAVKYYSNVMLLAPNTVETTGEEQAVIVYKNK
ncbi:MAG TPA: hypothetical protein DCW90_08440 [Lachnospiraceae bacterium]|nr:hypothetical protein [uncultured Lachnoclostridium sp.]HAU85515.1 hypothetical protein [Lachnospiraceae bacterium]